MVARFFPGAKNDEGLVRAEGLEPSRACAQRIFLPAMAFATAVAAFVVWTIPSPRPEP